MYQQKVDLDWWMEGLGREITYECGESGWKLEVMCGDKLERVNGKIFRINCILTAKGGPRLVDGRVGDRDNIGVWRKWLEMRGKVWVSM